MGNKSTHLTYSFVNRDYIKYLGDLRRTVSGMWTMLMSSEAEDKTQCKANTIGKL